MPTHIIPFPSILAIFRNIVSIRWTRLGIAELGRHSINSGQGRHVPV